MNTLFTNEDPGKEALREYTRLNKIKILFNLGERKTASLGDLAVSGGFTGLWTGSWTAAAVYFRIN